MQIEENQQAFWNNFPPQLQGILASAEEAIFTDPDYLELLTLAGETEAFYTFSDRVDGYPVKGFYYPVRFSDNYGLLFNSQIDDRDYLQSFKCFPTLRKLAADKQGNIGKTWIISGVLPRNSDTPLEILAEEAYQAAMFGKWQKVKKGNFLGATVFEIWQPPHSWDIEENHHAIIIFYPDVAAESEAAKYYEDWMKLFSYRNKIIWAYCESQKLRQGLQNSFVHIFQAGEILKQIPLKKLQVILGENIKILSQYASDLNHLEIQLHTIETNQKNYQEHLDHIIQKASKYGETDLLFLENFNKTVKQKYQLQIQQDIDSFSPALRVLEDVINTIRGIVEIEQAKRDRNLENIVAATGVGVGVASVAASAASALIKDITQPYPNQINNQQNIALPLANLIIVMLFSIGLGCLISGYTWKLLRYRR